MMSADYALLDSGSGRKLERLADLIVDRPCPQAVWARCRPDCEWHSARFRYRRGDAGAGVWEPRPGPGDEREIALAGLKLHMALTGFGHCGFFPEQAENWRWMRRTLASKPGARVLNLFAYSGASTLAAAQTGAQVTHVDAAKGMIDWARRNAAGNGLDGAPIRWLVDDVPKFLARELRRGSRYDAIILDPPSFGRGPRQEVWKLEDSAHDLLRDCAALLSDDARFVVVSTHTPGFTPLSLHILLEQAMETRAGAVKSFEMTVPHLHDARLLPAGSCARWTATIASEADVADL